MTAVRVERDGATATVRLHRPDAGNALDLAVKSALLDALREVAADDAVRAVLLTGSGPAFCVGQDLRELDAALRTDPAGAADTVEAHYNPITVLLATMPKPVVAAVNGTCVGAGLGFALACDLQVWSATATLSTAFTRVGLTCDSGLSATLVRAVGPARAAALVLLAEPFTVEQAVGWGFAGEVVAPADVEPTARALADRLAAGPTRAYAASKRLLAESAWRPLVDTLRAEATEQAALAVSRDHPAGVAAFLARETPTFTGH
ncbi:enoyl-CoA hydratase/isomerase family protein [Micromonospora cathayae]|uniref:Enoyl-CoA hydratase/isomerase family protein n=1 Tax=Micromonospora cathayae TaxID=3028804 RepID=A0ABY7ZL25_9ACTN|nr:enoyl-CoA hydratase/isomerase family protein [Micromonospora sp. HUAS 3]WDZ83661.1 enoyl-CoA hydratase/isomerase family protein [Micromonospora sp. HUAS 3]